MTTNQTRFSNAYRAALVAAISAYPEEYRFSVDEAPTVADRMLCAVAKGSYNKDGRAFKATCKALGLAHTYKAIDAFWNQPDEDKS
jgi:hypothetical protein